MKKGRKICDAEEMLSEIHVEKTGAVLSDSGMSRRNEESFPRADQSRL